MDTADRSKTNAIDYSIRLSRPPCDATAIDRLYAEWRLGIATLTFCMRSFNFSLPSTRRMSLSPCSMEMKAL